MIMYNTNDNHTVINSIMNKEKRSPKTLTEINSTSQNLKINNYDPTPTPRNFRYNVFNTLFFKTINIEFLPRNGLVTKNVMMNVYNNKCKTICNNKWL